MAAVASSNPTALFGAMPLVERWWRGAAVLTRKAGTQRDGWSMCSSGFCAAEEEGDGCKR